MRRWLEQLLQTRDTPARTAAAYSLGVFFGFSPVLGLHTVLGLIFAFGLHLNRVAVLLGVYSNLPWVMVPYYAFATWLGAVLLGTDLPPDVLDRLREGLTHPSWSELRRLAAALEPVLWAFAVGSTVAAALVAAAAYRVALSLICRRQRGREGSQPTDA